MLAVKRRQETTYAVFQAPNQVLRISSPGSELNPGSRARVTVSPLDATLVPKLSIFPFTLHLYFSRTGDPLLLRYAKLHRKRAPCDILSLGRQSLALDSKPKEAAQVANHLLLMGVLSTFLRARTELVAACNYNIAPFDTTGASIPVRGGKNYRHHDCISTCARQLKLTCRQCKGSTTLHAIFRACTQSCSPRHPHEADHTQAMHLA